MDAGDAHVITVRLPLRVRRRGGRKTITGPKDPASLASTHARPDEALIKAVARAFRWRKLIEAGLYTTVAELAAAEKVNASYASRILRITLLAPDIVEAIVDGRHPPIRLSALLARFPIDWPGQRSLLRN